MQERISDAKMLASKAKQHLLPFLVIAVISFVINVRHLNEPPGYIHAWAQSDNYSLAIGFLHNGGDLFHPQTLIFNKQQKDFDCPESLVTACDFPLHHWIVAGLMSVTGSSQPWVFRGWTLAVSILGVWALYLLAFMLTSSRAKSLLVATFTATAPSFAYYSGSFIPTVPALALAMGGLLFYALHLRESKIWMLYVSLFLLTLAMMVRTSFAVLWVAVACFQVLRIFRKEASLKDSWIPFVAGVGLFVAWWLWSWHLRQQYVSLFLGSLLPVQSKEKALFVLQNVHDRWRFHYFQQLQHWLYMAVAVGVVVTLALKKVQLVQGSQKLSLWWFWLIWMFGEVLFAVAMLLQFSDHDYYFLDSFFLPIVLSLVGLLRFLPNFSNQWGRVLSFLIVLALAGTMTVNACQMQKVRRLEGIEAFQTAVRYKTANRMLEDAGYGSKNLRFLTMFSYPQNTPFVMMDREGYSVMRPRPAVVAHALTFDYDYILVEDEVYRREFDEAPYILPHLRRLAGNGEISVCTLSDSILHETAEDFFK